MNLRHFWNSIPRPVQVAAFAIVSTAALVGLLAGPRFVTAHCAMAGHGGVSSGFHAVSGLGIGLLFGSLASIWLLSLGYVYADARRRAMQPVLWTLVAALVPNLLGFLLYFAMRRPITTPCVRCGHGMEADVRFCSWCGHDRLTGAMSTPAAPTPTAPGAPS